MGCTNVGVVLDAGVVPEGGSFDVETDRDDELSCASDDVICDQEAYEISIRNALYRPKTITVIVLDAEGAEDARYDANPTYGVIEQDLCNCPGAETVFVP